MLLVTSRFCNAFNINEIEICNARLEKSPRDFIRSQSVSSSLSRRLPSRLYLHIYKMDSSSKQPVKLAKVSVVAQL
jgi:hypothetical protein